MQLKERMLSTRLLPGQIALYYLGQEGFLIQYQDTFILMDGYLSDYVDRHFYSAAVPWRRRYPAPITGKDLDFVDYVFCSHAHEDHADPDTLRDIARVNGKARFIAPAPIVSLLAGYGVPEDRILPALADQPLALGPITALPVPAAHEQLSPDAEGRFDCLGYRLTLGETILYHAGDCCVYEGLTERLAGVDIALLPINGRDFDRLRHHIIGNMDAKEAIALAARIDARLLIPMHYDLYAVNCVSPAYFVDCMERSEKRIPFHLFQPGERYIYMADR